MVNIKFLGCPLGKNQDISLLVTNLVRKLMKKISSIGYCPKNVSKIPKALWRFDKKFGNFWTNFRWTFRYWQPSISIEIKNRRIYLVGNSQKITKDLNNLIKAYKKV